MHLTHYPRNEVNSILMYLIVLPYSWPQLISTWNNYSTKCKLMIPLKWEWQVCPTNVITFHTHFCSSLHMFLFATLEIKITVQFSKARIFRLSRKWFFYLLQCLPYRKVWMEKGENKLLIVHVISCDTKSQCHLCIGGQLHCASNTLVHLDLLCLSISWCWPPTYTHIVFL